MDLQDRIDRYVRETRFPRSLFMSEDGRIVGTVPPSVFGTPD